MNTKNERSRTVIASTPLPPNHWPTLDPFLFCAHHNDAYPAGNDEMGPQASLDGRRIGMDFDNRDGWNMYHGDVVPGFPMHPHRGFETITIARNGFIDHHDSMGASARFGNGDVQWMTAGGGVVHSEMFPLVNRDAPNPTELFQIWLNLPAASKRSEPYFTMLWNEVIPAQSLDEGRAELKVVAGSFGDVTPLPAPPDSWASNKDADVAVWTLKLEPGATVTLPAATSPEANRVLYFFVGDTFEIDGESFEAPHAVQLVSTSEVTLTNGTQAAEALVLQGRPIGEPVAKQGPFVMNTAAEIQETIREYQRTQFGGWPFGSHAPVHPRDEGRFAKHADGRVEAP